MRRSKTPKWVRVVDAMARQAEALGKTTMPDARKTPFPFPPLEGAEVRFPDAPPLDVEIARMSNWWLRLTCACGDTHTPLRLLAAERGWRITLRRLVPKLRCKRCGERPASVLLEDTPAENGYRSARQQVKTLRLK